MTSNFHFQLMYQLKVIKYVHPKKFYKKHHLCVENNQDVKEMLLEFVSWTSDVIEWELVNSVHPR